MGGVLSKVSSVFGTQHRSSGRIILGTPYRSIKQRASRNIMAAGWGTNALGICLRSIC